MNTERLIHYVFVAGENPEHLRKLKQASLRSAGLAFVYIGSYEAPVPNSVVYFTPKLMGRAVAMPESHLTDFFSYMNDGGTRQLPLEDESGTLFFFVSKECSEVKARIEEETTKLEAKVVILTIPPNLEGNPALIAFPGADWFTKDKLKDSTNVVSDVINYQRQNGISSRRENTVKTLTRVRSPDTQMLDKGTVVLSPNDLKVRKQFSEHQIDVILKTIIGCLIFIQIMTWLTASSCCRHFLW